MILDTLPEGFTTVSLDESFFFYDSLVRRVWIYKDYRPVVKVAGSHKLNNHNESERMTKLATRTISAVEEKLWSESDRSYIDIQQSHHIGGPYKTLTQDVSLYLVAISGNTNSDSLRIARTTT